MPGPSSTDKAKPSQQAAQRLRRRRGWVAGLGLTCVLLASHWVWALIAGMTTLFLVFALDDEVQRHEQGFEQNL